MEKADVPSAAKRDMDRKMKMFSGRRYGGPMSMAALLSVIFMLWAITGCGPQRPETVRVSGTVTLDGKPSSGAAVMLMPKQGGRPAAGVTDESGEFSLTTFEQGDGALPGEHTVTVTLKKVTGILADRVGLSGGVAPGGIKVQWLVPEKYSSSKTSGLAVEVKRSMEPLVLELKSA